MPIAILLRSEVSKIRFYYEVDIMNLIEEYPAGTEVNFKERGKVHFAVVTSGYPDKVTLGSPSGFQKIRVTSDEGANWSDSSMVQFTIAERNVEETELRCADLKDAST